MSTEENKALVRRVLEEMNGENTGSLAEYLVADYIYHDPSLPPQMQQGRDNYVQGVGMFYTAFPDLKCTIEDQVAEGEKVATRITWTGTHKGELMGVPASGKSVHFTMMVLHRIVRAKVTEGWVNFDAMAMLQQIGAIPQPEQASA